MKLFYCYSLPLKKYLIESGHKYLHSGTHNQTKRTFYVFEGTETLNECLENWKLGKR